MRLRLITRADLPPGLASAQAAHVFGEFREEHPEIAKAWRLASNTLVHLEVGTEEALHDLVALARLRQVAHTVWREPDLGNQVTAVALEPSDDATWVARRVQADTFGA